MFYTVRVLCARLLLHRLTCPPTAYRVWTVFRGWPASSVVGVARGSCLLIYAAVVHVTRNDVRWYPPNSLDDLALIPPAESSRCPHCKHRAAVTQKTLTTRANARMGTLFPSTIRSSWMEGGFHQYCRTAARQAHRMKISRLSFVTLGVRSVSRRRH